METALDIISVIAIVVCPPLLVYGLALADIMFTIVKEGEAKIILKNGRFHRVIMSYSGWQFHSEPYGHIPANDLDDHAWDIIPSAGSGRSGGLFFGVHFIGIPPFYSVFSYNFRWTSVDETGGFKKRDEILWSVFVKNAVYGLEMKEVEDAGQVPMDLKFNLLIQVVNPAKALMRAQHWLDDTLNYVSAELRVEHGKAFYAEFIKSTAFQQDPNDNEVDYRQRVIDGVCNCNTNFLLSEYGARVTRIAHNSIDPSGDLRKITIAKEQAKRNAEVTAINAEAEAKAIERVNEATLGGNNPGALVLAQLRALEKTKANVVVNPGQVGLMNVLNQGSGNNASGQ